MIPLNGWVMYETDVYTAEEMQYYTELDAEVLLFEHIFIGGAVTTRSRTAREKYGIPYNFSPFTDEYLFKAGIRFGNVEIGFRHLCTHPVIPYINSVRQVNRTPITYEGAYEEIYLRFEGRL